jgi:hypothetical protein
MQVIEERQSRGGSSSKRISEAVNQVNAAATTTYQATKKYWRAATWSYRRGREQGIVIDLHPSPLPRVAKALYHSSFEILSVNDHAFVIS